MKCRGSGGDRRLEVGIQRLKDRREAGDVVVGCCRLAGRKDARQCEGLDLGGRVRITVEDPAVADQPDAVEGFGMCQSEQTPVRLVGRLDLGWWEGRKEDVA